MTLCFFIIPDSLKLKYFNSAGTVNEMFVSVVLLSEYLCPSILSAALRALSTASWPRLEPDNGKLALLDILSEYNNFKTI